VHDNTSLSFSATPNKRGFTITGSARNVNKPTIGPVRGRPAMQGFFAFPRVPMVDNIGAGAYREMKQGRAAASEQSCVGRPDSTGKDRAKQTEIANLALPIQAGRRSRVVFSSKDPAFETDNWAGLLTSGSIYWLRLPAGPFDDGKFATSFDRRQWPLCSVRPRLQRRDRNGIAPFSLFFPPDTESRKTPMSTAHPIGTNREVKPMWASVKSLLLLLVDVALNGPSGCRRRRKGRLRRSSVAYSDVSRTAEAYRILNPPRQLHEFIATRKTGRYPGMSSRVLFLSLS
jgi:hypothetical protein